MALKHLRSTTANKRPQASGLSDGQLAMNTASGSPGLFFKDTAGNIVKIGPVHVGSTAPNVSPASGGTTGNSIGEQWLDNSGGAYVFKIWDGVAWRSESGEFVNAAGDTMTGSLTMGASANIIFEGSVDDGFETTLTVANPTADRTITLPNVTGTVVTTGDSGSVTSAMIADNTIVDADVNASAAIAGTKISPNFGSQNVTTTGTSTAASFIPASSSVPTNGLYLPTTNSVALSTNGTGRLFVDATGNVGVGSASIPRGPLSIYNSAAPLLHFWNDTTTSGGNNGTSLYGFQDDFAIQNRETNGAIQFLTANTERLRITSAGLVGIGTSAPNTRLSVVGTATGLVNGAIRTNTTAATQSANSGLWLCGNQSTSHYNWLIASQFNVGGALEITPSTAVDGATFTTPTAVFTHTGRVGIGTTSPNTGLEVNGTTNIASRALFVRSDQSTTAAIGGFFDVSNCPFVGSTSNSAFAFITNSTERARIDSSGRLLVGTSNSTDNTRLNSKISVVGIGTNQYPGISINGYTGTNAGPAPFIDLNRSRGTTDGSYTEVVNNDVLGYIVFRGSDGVAWSEAANIQAAADGDWTTSGDTTDSPGRLVFSTTADGASSPTERMRIDSLGRVMIGTTTAGGVNGMTFDDFTAAARIQLNKSFSGTATGVNFMHNGVQVGSITYSNSATAYNTSSDYRLKENVVAVTDGITRLQQLKPSRFNFIADPGRTVDGFLAHEVQTIVPEAITGEKDAVDDEGNPVYQGIDQSKLVPLLTAALQEAIGEIESLKARVAALETP